MGKLRYRNRDPRTVARDIPGIFDIIFPQLAPGIVTYLNRRARSMAASEKLSEDLIQDSSLKHAMLFEIAVAVAEQLLAELEFDIKSALAIAIQRQRRHFDAVLPDKITDIDVLIIRQVAENLVLMLNQIDNALGERLEIAPDIPGYEWISSGQGDFALGSRLIEVKCTGKLFSSSDFRQVMMYWLLSYAHSVDGRGKEWTDAVLINPRLNRCLEIPFNELLYLIGGGRSKVEILQLFAFMVADHMSEP